MRTWPYSAGTRCIMNTFIESDIIVSPPERLRAEIAVVGSGPGGAIMSCLLAEAGRNVLLIEEGSYLNQDSCVPFSHQEMAQKYRCGGVTVAMGRSKIAYVEGRCVGGGSEINGGLYHRTPADILENWVHRYEIEGLTQADLEPHFAACEKDLRVSYLPGPAPVASLKLHEGAQALGWKSLEVPRWFIYKRESKGERPKGERQSMIETFVPRALAAGARLLPDTRVLRLTRQDAGWRLRAEHKPPGDKLRRVWIDAEIVFLACGAIQTPALLRRSGIKHNVGDTLKFHSTVKVVARFPDEVNAVDMGVPVHQVKEFAPRFSFGCSISTPAHLALAMLDHPRHLHEVDSCWRQMAIYYAMIAGGNGIVRPVTLLRDPLVRYRLEDADLSDLSDALRDLCRTLLAAGAEALYPSVTGHPVIRCERDLTKIPRPLPPANTQLMTVHLMASCPMGEKRGLCAVDSFGKVYSFQNLYVADASLLGGALGVNPQGTIMAYVRRNAMKFLGQL